MKRENETVNVENDKLFSCTWIDLLFVKLI